jgi:hypothetical protein
MGATAPVDRRDHRFDLGPMAWGQEGVSEEELPTVGRPSWPAVASGVGIEFQRSFDDDDPFG